MSLPIVRTTTTDLAGAILAAKVDTSEASAGGQSGFLKFNFRDGEWTFGREAEEVTGDTLLVNVRSISHGWSLWAGGQPTKVWSSFTEPLPAPPAPIDGKVAEEARAFQAAFFDDGTPGPSATLELSSYGGKKAFAQLIEEIKGQAVKNPAYLFPLVTLSSESYKNKKHGTTIYNPVFEIADWANEAGELEGAAPASLTAPTPAPAPAPEPEVAPARRRRIV